MSILARMEEGVATEPELTVGSVACLGVALLASLLAAWAMGVFRPRSIHGPPRLAGHEPAWPLLLIMLAGASAWIMVPALYQAARMAATQPVDERQEVLRPVLPADPVDTVVAPAEFSDLELLTVGAGAAVFGFLVLMAGNVLYRRNGLARLGMAVPQLPAGLLGGVLAGAVIFVPMLLVLIGTVHFWRIVGLDHPDAHEVLQILGDRRGEPLFLALVLFAAVVVAPFFEELLFRGHMQTLIRRGTGSPWAAVIVASILFAVVHPWWTIPPIFILSVFIGYAYERTGNLWVPIVMHAVFNGAQTTLFLLAPWLERLAEQGA